MKKMHKVLIILIIFFIFSLTGCTRKYNDIVIKDKKEIIIPDYEYYYYYPNQKPFRIFIQYEGVSKINVYGESTSGILFVNLKDYVWDNNEMEASVNYFGLVLIDRKLPIQYIDIIFSDDYGILGYGVIRLDGPTKPYDDNPHVVVETSAIFPKVKGKKQNVTIEQVKEIIEKERKVPLSNEKDA